MKYLGPITDGKDLVNKEYVDGGIEAANRVVYGICDTAADDPGKEVILSCRDLDNLGKGVLLSVYFTYGNTASNPALFLYNSDETDDKPPDDIVLWADESTHITYLAGPGAWRNGEQVLFTMLSSGEWQIVGRQPALSDRYGVVELSDAVDSESGADSAKGLFPGPALAATPKAVKQAYDLAASKQDPITGGNGVEITGGTNVGLTDKFYNYLVRETFEIPTLTLTMSGVGVDREIGTPLSITGIKHRETYIDSIKSETLAFYRDNGLVEYINPSATEATVTLGTEITENPTADAQHAYVLKCTDTMPGAPTPRSSNTVTAKWYRYAYSALNNDTTNPPVSGNTKQTPISTFASNGASFNYAVGQCLWLFTTKADAKIQTNVLGQWADVTFYNAGPVQLVQANDATHTYYAYRTAVFDGAGTAKYRVL